MPSRLAAVAIVLLWLAVTGYLGYTRVLPWLTASAAPAVTVSATDEAGRQKVRWVVLFKSGKGGFEKAGTLTTEMTADDTDTFTFVAKYTDLRFEIGPFPVRVPTATTEVTTDRAGQLRRQSVSGSAVFKGFGAEVSGSAAVTSRVVGGELRGRVEGRIPELNLTLEPMDLPSVPVPSGQVLNPLLPVNRLSGVEPGKRWTIRQVDPLGDSLKQLLQALAKRHGFGAALPGGGDRGEELLAEVLADIESLPARRNEDAIPCRVIEYRGKDNKVAARTWVSAADGRVMRQEATADGNSLRLNRDE